jgi:2-oxoglutarate ferredoxin oxidoreductase subunit gamma
VTDDLELLIAGFGGQGILFAGEALARAALIDGKHTTWLPAYGPEQRGGTATCAVVVSDETIGSPVVADPAQAIIMNQPSLERFESAIRSQGLVIVNTSMVPRAPRRPDVRVIPVDAQAEAEAAGSAKVANMVVLGALIEATGVVTWDALEQAVSGMLESKRKDLIEVNLKAARRGARIAAESLAPPA